LSPLKERTSMSKRLTAVTVMLGTVFLLFILPLASASASSPWWQVLAGSRPSNLWKASDNVQELEVQTVELFPGFSGAAIKVEVRGEVVACLGSGSVGSFLCPALTTFAPEETASELEATLKTALGTESVEVTGGPVGVEPFTVVVHGSGAPAIGLEPVTPIAGKAKATVLSQGGSGRLVLTITNLGDAEVDATSSPVTVVDHLPEGVVATGVEGFAGAENESVNCAVEAPTEVVCKFEGASPSYEGLEVEILASLTGDPPMAGAPGEVTVSGGNAPPASAVQPLRVSPEPTPFGAEQFSAQAEEEGGELATQAGGHPFQFTTTIEFNAGTVSPELGRPGRFLKVEQPGLPRNLKFSLPAGLVGNATVMPTCDMGTFLTVSTEGVFNKCSDATAIGVASVTVLERAQFGVARVAAPVFNLPPAIGEPARFGIMALGTPVVIDTAVDPDNAYQINASVHNLTQSGTLLASTVSLWGSPGDPRHDSARGWSCVWAFSEIAPCVRPAGLGEEAFLRQPVSCGTPLNFGLQLEPWNVPLGSEVKSASYTAEGLRGCNQVPFNPSINAAPTGKSAGGATGLTFQLNMPNSGLLNSKAVAAEGQPKRVEVTLPEGMTVNPSQANGLGACTPLEYASVRVDSTPDEGCPESSKIGTVDIKTPLLEEEAHGSVYVAAPFDNPFGSLLALYVVARIPDRGILVKQAGKIELNSQTGQLVSTFDDLPQIPFSSFDLHFQEGPRAPLVMPSSCGSYELTAKLTPWNAADPNNPQPSEIITKASSFAVDQGPNGATCPSGTPPFKPGFTAGTENNAAGSYSPLDVRLTREDGEQEFKTFSLKMPEGVTGKLAGIPFCSDAAVAAARTRTGANGGQEELDQPSCPEGSQIGTVLVGAGVGPTLTYAPGKLYLAGPYKGAKLSVVAITTAKVGPFDLGNVVIRQGLKVDPDTAQVSTDGSSADPIPHILQGIVVHARDIRINVDRKDFILNPTSCERMKAAASVLGSGNDTADVSAPFQAADCARLGFKPKLSLSLKGGIRRGAHPRLKAVLKARKGDANIGAAVVKLPHSEFLEQGHIRTICTRVQFAAGSGNGSRCPKGSVYGRARAISPLLDEPLVGLVYLRSSNHPLPDLVAALHSKKVDINLDGRIDAVNGGIRNSFEAVPDAPVTKFVLEMQGGKKGLLVNSTNICQGKHRARASFTGQNGKLRVLNPLVKARCGGRHKHRSKH
jgi:hypothetical protein